MDLNEVIGRNVRKKRQELGLSQEQVAHDAQIALRYFAGVERGQENPSVAVLARIANALGVHPAWLLEG